jgi:hypothetical protein
MTTATTTDLQIELRPYQQAALTAYPTITCFADGVSELP